MLQPWKERHPPPPKKKKKVPSAFSDFLDSSMDTGRRTGVSKFQRKHQILAWNIMFPSPQKVNLAAMETATPDVCRLNNTFLPNIYSKDVCCMLMLIFFFFFGTAWNFVLLTKAFHQTLSKFVNILAYPDLTFQNSPYFLPGFPMNNLSSPYILHFSQITQFINLHSLLDWICWLNISNFRSNNFWE